MAERGSEPRALDSHQGPSYGSSLVFPKCVRGTLKNLLNTLEASVRHNNFKKYQGIICLLHSLYFSSGSMVCGSLSLIGNEYVLEYSCDFKNIQLTSNMLSSNRYHVHKQKLFRLPNNC